MAFSSEADSGSREENASDKAGVTDSNRPAVSGSNNHGHSKLL
jgi:hypothetical protein